MIGVNMLTFISMRSMLSDVSYLIKWCATFLKFQIVALELSLVWCGAAAKELREAEV